MYALSTPAHWDHRRLICYLSRVILTGLSRIGGRHNQVMSSDVFLRILAPTRPSVSIVDKDLFGSDVGLYRERRSSGACFAADRYADKTMSLQTATL